MKNLVIVESPAKAKTIEGYLGEDYVVKSSYGHVRDLPKGDIAVDIENDFQPTYEVSKDKVALVKELKSLAKKSKCIYLASDDDREGEAISWHLSEALKLEEEKTKRIVFREITKSAILSAISNPRKIDIGLVNSQQARRILDRLVGFELSPILWKKIKTGLSAGRVQSVAVRLVVEREREIIAFESQIFYKVTANFTLPEGELLRSQLAKKLSSEEEAKELLSKCLNASFLIESIEKKTIQRSPSAPFTTSTLQQEASRKLGYSVSRTMILAQKLYEAGKISYMRTDSVHLSNEFLGAAERQITKKYGAAYAKRRTYKNKNESAQEAHEAIRPTSFEENVPELGNSENKLYQLIWKRTVACQMANAQLEKSVVTIGIFNAEEKLIAQGEVVVFDGFLKVYRDFYEDDPESEKGLLPPLRIGQSLELKNMLAKQIFSKNPPRYNEANLVKKLEELGIGRPSTYAPTISTIQKRNYAEKESREGYLRDYVSINLENKKIEKTIQKERTGVEKNKLFPTNTAMVVNDFLVKNFFSVIDYHFTAEVEEQFDKIAHEGASWKKMLDSFYEGFHAKVQETESLERENINKPRLLGKDPETEKYIYVKHGKYGAYVQKGELIEGKEKPKYASLKHGQFIESITLKEALDLFELPRELGEMEEEEITVSVGRFGPYVKHNNKFVSLKKDQDPLSITHAEAVDLILEKRKIDAQKHIKTFEEDSNISILNGRFGPYIKAGKKNIKIPKEKDPHQLTHEEVVEMIAKAPERKGRRSNRAKS